MNPVRFRLLGFLGLLILAGGAAGPARGEPDGLTFAWPVPSRVKVREIAEKKGNTATSEYELVLERTPDGSHLQVRFENHRFISVNGMDASAPEVKQALGPAAALAGAIPSLRVTHEGAYVDAVGMEEAVDRTLAFMKANEAGKLDEAKWRQLEATMRAPQMVAQMRAKVGDYWNVWVGLWAGTPLAPGGEHAATTEIPMPDGSTLQAPVRYRHLGPAEGSPDLVKLEAGSVLEGEEATQALERSVRALAESSGQPAPPDKIYASFRREFKATVVTDPKTLQPSQATSEVLAIVTMVDGKVGSQKESRQYTFTWVP